MKSSQLLLPFGFRAINQNSPSHHLYRKRSGLFQMRFTVDRGPKFVGERVKISLRTRDPEEAKLRRDVILTALSKAKFVSDR